MAALIWHSSVSSQLRYTVALAIVLLFAGRCFAQDVTSAAPSPKASSAQDLSQLSIADLINMEVTSPSKKSEKFNQSASAIFVITSEDIRRSGATSIPELLRLVPGFDVGRIDNDTWAISARGFNAVYGDKLLVLMDGRSIYTPLFGGVFWNEHDTVLEDIERIEVIRGPGATLYGANAVNGVINIITKDSQKTQGGLVSAGGGNQERGFGTVRYGAQTGDIDYRAYAKYFDRQPNQLDAGGNAHDAWQGVRSGFRADTQNENDKTTVQGDYYYEQATVDQIAPNLDTFADYGQERKYINGGNLLGRWTRTFSPTSDLSLQTYFDHTYRDEVVIRPTRNLVDTDLQYRFSPATGHDVVSGLGYRVYRDDIGRTFRVWVDPTQRTVELFTGFIQDEITLISDRLKLIVGSKLEHNDFSGFEVMPGVRLVNTVDEKNTIWGAVSHSVRSPTRFNNDGHIILAVMPGDNGIPIAPTLSGDRNYDSEKLLAYELGYRSQLADNFSLDLASFINDYHNLESAELRGSPFLNSFENKPYIEVPLYVDNRLVGETLGGEVLADWRPFKSWRLVGSYSYLDMRLRRTGNSTDTIFLGGQGQSPANQFYIRSLIDLPHNFEFDSMLRYVGAIGTFNVDSYTTLDLRLGYKVSRNVDVSIIGQNLLQPSHMEFSSNLVDTQRTAISRGVFGKVTWKF